MLFNEESMYDMFSEGEETKEGNQIIAEAIIEDALLENGLVMLDEDIALDMLNEELLSERNIIKFDKKTKRKYNTNKAAVVIAKEKNDRDYKKLVKVYKMRKLLLGRIMKKYGTKAKIRARQMETNHGMATALSKIKGRASVQKVDINKK
jgi:hypothetical protein